MFGLAPPPYRLRPLLIPVSALLDQFAQPETYADPSGDWPFGPLRFQLLRRAFDLDFRSPALAETLLTSTDRLSAAGLSRPQPLQPRHERGDFDCGTPVINERLKDTGSYGPLEGIETWVLVDREDRVGAYYATRPARIRSEAPAGGEPLPVTLICSIGIDRAWAGRGGARAMVGALYQQAWELRTHRRSLGVMGFAITPQAKAFFEHCGARPMGEAIHPTVILTTIKDIAGAVGEPL